MDPIFVVSLAAVFVAVAIAVVGAYLDSSEKKTDSLVVSNAKRLTLQTLLAFDFVELSDDTTVSVWHDEVTLHGKGRTRDNLSFQISAKYEFQHFGGERKWLRKSLSIDGQEFAQRMTLVGTAELWSRDGSIPRKQRALSSDEELKTLATVVDDGYLLVRVLATGEIGWVLQSEVVQTHVLLDEIGENPVHSDEERR